LQFTLCGLFVIFASFSYKYRANLALHFALFALSGPLPVPAASQLPAANINVILAKKNIVFSYLDASYTLVRQLSRKKYLKSVN